MNERTQGAVGKHESPEFLLNEIRGLGTQGQPWPSQVGLYFIENEFGFPAFVVESGKFKSRRSRRVKDRRHETVDLVHAVDGVLDHPHRDLILAL